jgi:hypothetical protein
MTGAVFLADVLEMAFCSSFAEALNALKLAQTLPVLAIGCFYGSYCLEYPGFIMHRFTDEKLSSLNKYACCPAPKIMLESLTQAQR